MGNIKVKAKCIKCNYQKDDYRIFGWSPIGETKGLKLSQYFTFSTKGNDSYITEGNEYELELEELSSSPQWGGTYKIVDCPTMAKIDLAKLTEKQKFEIIMDCTSSERIANNIISAYPNFIEKVLTEGKESIDTSLIKGVGEAYLNSYVRTLNEKYKYYAILQYFKPYELDIADCKVLVEFHNNQDGIEKAITENPYSVLVGELRRSFEKADKLIISLRPELKVSEMRCSYLILSVLQRNELDGSTRLNGNDLYYYILNEYNVPELEPLIVPTATTNDLFFYDEKSKDLSIMDTYNGECLINDFIKERLENSKVLSIDWTKYKIIDDFTMSDKQASALEMFCKYNFMILAGFSGSGKTTSLKGLIKLMEDNGLSYTLLAPTGKASLRMTESVHRPASTIHRKCLRDGDINSDVIIVDECSMVDLPTFTMLLKCITNSNVRVVVVGDNAQLMPVGIGCVFNDMINSGSVPMVMLDEVFRYKTNGGLFVATNVRQGKTFFGDTEMVKETDNTYSICSNYKFIKSENVFESLIREYNTLLNKGIKPNEILCLSPFNVGSIGTYEINNAIQSEVNPPKVGQDNFVERKVQNGRSKTTITFRVGDRVINKKNDYNALPLESYNEIISSNGILTESDVETTSVFNGQDGVIRQITDSKDLIIQFDEELIVFTKEKINNLLLAYCISVHSSQGSEAQYVINVVSSEHSRMLNRNLLYVADTRSKKMQIDIGDCSAFESALNVDGNAERNTWLHELLLA